jgi:hypothetical protein
MPSNNRASYKQANIDKRASMNHANPKTENPARFASVSTTLPNRGKTPQFRFLIETRKCVLYIQIITDSDNRPQTRFRQSHHHARSRIPRIRHYCDTLPHTIPATPHDATLYNATRYTLADPVTLYKRYTLTAHGSGL